jgi:hypothetical protein
MRRITKLAIVGLLTLSSMVGGAVLLAGSRPLRATGPTHVAGSTAAESFTIGNTTYRQVRYVDRARLRYTFTLVNTGIVPLRVVGLAPPGRRATLLRPQHLDPLTLGPYERGRVTVRVLMTDCERLSARAGSIVTELRVRIRILGLVPRTVTVPLAEQLRVSSARESSCPRATSTSRPPG